MFRWFWTDQWAQAKQQRALAEHYSLLAASPAKQNWKLLFVQEYLSRMGNKS